MNRRQRFATWLLERGPEPIVLWIGERLTQEVVVLVDQRRFEEAVELEVWLNRAQRRLGVNESSYALQERRKAAEKAATAAGRR